MRTLTTAQLKLIQSPDSVRHFRVKVKDSGGTWRTLNSLEGYDWIRRCTRSAGIDQPPVTLTVTCPRRIEHLSLAPLVTTSKLNNLTGSYSPLIAEGRPVTVEVAITASCQLPTASDWVEVFRGEIDEADSASGNDTELVFTVRDQIGRLIDTLIQAEATYGSAEPGTAIETVMQQILTAGNTGQTLWVPTSPGYGKTTFVQEKVNVFAALEQLADLFGGVVRSAWNPAANGGAGGWQPKLILPDRTAAVPSLTWYPGPRDSTGAGQAYYRTVSELKTSRLNVRNKWSGWYFDPADLDESKQPKKKNITVSDPTSISRYGGEAPAVERFAEISLSATDQINSASRMTTMLNSILADTKDPTASWVMVTPLAWFLELGDLQGIKANGEHFTSDQVLAVAEIEDDYVEGTSTVRLRGKPAAKSQRWLAYETRVPLNDSPPVTGPNAPTNLYATPVVGGSTVTFQKPTSDTFKVARVEAHISTSSGFTPTQATLDGETDGTAYTFSGLSMGQTYYVKFVPRDDVGNRGTASAQVAVTAGDLPQGIGQFDGVTIRQLAKGHYSGTARHTAAILFPQGYQAPPMVILRGGILHQPAAKWGATGDHNASPAETGAYTSTAPTYEDMAAVDLTAAGFTLRARLRQKSGSTLRTASADTANNNLTAVGQSAAATLNNAPSGAAGDAYTLRYKVAVTASDPINVGDGEGGLPYVLTVSAVIAVDSSIDGGTNWVERAAYTYSASARSDTAGSTWGDEQKTVNVAGLTSGAPADKMRIRVKSFTFNGTSGTVSAHLFSTAASPADAGPGLSYYTASDQYTSKTPDVDDVIFWEAIEVS